MNMEEYTHTKEFFENLKAQEKYFREDTGVDYRDVPFNDWDGFLSRYYFIRRGLSSLLKNPDTMNDPDFIELCRVWRNQRFGYNASDRLDDLYKKLERKQVFSENPIFRELRGKYIKSVYQLFNDEYYTQNFFELDD